MTISKLPVKRTTLTEILMSRYASIVIQYNELVTTWSNVEEIKVIIDSFGEGIIEPEFILNNIVPDIGLSVIKTMLAKMRMVIMSILSAYNLPKNQRVVADSLLWGISETELIISHNSGATELKINTWIRKHNIRANLFNIETVCGNLNIVALEDINITIPNGVNLVFELPCTGTADYTIVFEEEYAYLELDLLIDHYSTSLAMLRTYNSNSDNGKVTVDIKKGSVLGKLCLRNDSPF